MIGVAPSRAMYMIQYIIIIIQWYAQYREFLEWSMLSTIQYGTRFRVQKIEREWNQTRMLHQRPIRIHTLTKNN